jgi:hypothetical protein
MCRRQTTRWVSTELGASASRGAGAERTTNAVIIPPIDSQRLARVRRNAHAGGVLLRILQAFLDKNL